MIPDSLIRLELSFDPAQEDLVIGLLYMHVAWGWEDMGLLNDLRQVRVHCDRPEQATDLEAVLQATCPDIRIARTTVDNADWTSAWKQFFTPIAIGERFVVLPAWSQDTPGAAEPIYIEPKMAFGTGHHHTTALCLHTLVALAAQGKLHAGQTFLDLGTGSGILAIAAAKLGLCGLGVDIDPVAIDNAQENITLNNVGQHITLHVGTIDHVPTTPPYDCILANILANPLIDMAPEICARLARPGILILSGILTDQVARVSAAYTACGLPEPDVRTAEDWAALTFCP
ncbi:50S ribosomal protein L11 methyltransferase [Desulfovibrionales bacterium]